MGPIAKLIQEQMKGIPKECLKYRPEDEIVEELSNEGEMSAQIKAPVVLYHYTDLNAMMSMLKNDSYQLWLSDTRFMNMPVPKPSI